MVSKFATPVLMACIVFFGMVTATGLYEHMFYIPEMLKSPAAMILAGNNNLGQAQKFWLPLHALILITIIISLVLNWKVPGRKKLILYSIAGFIYINLISIYFAKKLGVFIKMPDSADFHQQTQEWITLSWHRPLLMVFIEVILLIALSRPASKSAA